MQWTRDAERLATQAGDELVTREVVVAAPETVKLQDVVPPIHFESGVAEVPDSTVAELRQRPRSRARQEERATASGRPCGHPAAVAEPRPALRRQRRPVARTRRAKLRSCCNRRSALPAEAISYEWAGANQPIADNSTAAGRAANRRVAVEIWYDEFKDATGTEEFVVKNDIKQVKVCRMETVCKLRYIEGHERRARVQNLVAPLHYDDASPQLSPTFVAQVQRTLENLRDKQHVVAKFIGYTDNSPLAEREARIYGDHETLSKARARRVAVAIQERTGIAGRGGGQRRPRHRSRDGI